jgi:hypothetical protein
LYTDIKVVMQPEGLHLVLPEVVEQEAQVLIKLVILTEQMEVRQKLQLLQALMYIIPLVAVAIEDGAVVAVLLVRMQLVVLILETGEIIPSAQVNPV